MRIQSRWPAVLVFVISLLVCQQVKAAAITGKVTSVNDGDEITIFNLNRQVRIKLLAIDAPEKDQAFGAAAKQHLFDLVYDKVVSVEYQGVGQHSILIGRVLLDGNDICAQMVRDGAAWFNQVDKNLLTAEQSEIYFQSEQAARAEKRGLWQTGNAVAPWEFVKAEEQKKSMTPTSTRAVSGFSGPPNHVKPSAELDSMGLLRTGSSSSRSVSVPGWADGSMARTWQRFQPPRESFSALVPDGGKQDDVTFNFAGQVMPFSIYTVKEGESYYQVFWATDPYGGPDADALDETFYSYKTWVNRNLEQSGFDKCEPSAVRNISVKGYLGREYEMTQCTMPTVMRIYAKESGGKRLIYGGLVAFGVKSSNATKFLKGLTVGGGAPKNEGLELKTMK
jgi:endonuclease YncB( thermonuclease family)